MAIYVFVLSQWGFFASQNDVFVPRDFLLVKGNGGEKIATFRIDFEVVNWLDAACHSRGTKPPCSRAKVAPRQDKQKANIILNNNCICLSHCDFCSPTWQFCTTWMASCKGPICNSVVGKERRKNEAPFTCGFRLTSCDSPKWRPWPKTRGKRSLLAGLDGKA